jgi:hypothetical protein
MATRLIGTDSDDPWLPDDVSVRAAQTTIVDAAGRFAATTVEAALAELAVAVDAGGGETGGTGFGVATFLYSVASVARPDADIVFWIPSTSSLADPTNALTGDVVLRSVEDAVQGLNDATGIWLGSEAEYAAITPDPGVVYVVTA